MNYTATKEMHVASTFAWGGLRNFSAAAAAIVSMTNRKMT